MKVIVAEKPDQGHTLASPFPSKKRDGYVEILPNDTFPNGAYVTWAIGHITQLIAPEKYKSEWKKWSLSTLPIIPEQFEYEVVKEKRKQYSIIKKLVSDSNVKEIIHAGDAGREGELIVRNILRLCKCRKPMKRLWISSLTENAIKKGFASLLSEEETRPIYYEAYTRACADWLVGMNASRLYTLLLQQKGIEDVFSVGRVQTPTLALIVRREHEIEQFSSKPFWEVLAKFIVDGKKYEGKWHKDGESRVDSLEMANKIAEFCNGKKAVVTNVEKERKEYQPPYLFNLSSLQTTANQMFKYSPKKTLEIAQKLYQKGIISYPRSDSSFVTKEEAKTFPLILEKVQKFSQYENLFPIPINSIENNKRFVNEKKVTDHYAIIPTEKTKDPKTLSADEEKIYDLVIRRLISAHYEPNIVDYTTVTTVVDERATFESKGKQLIQDGWKKVFPSTGKEKEPPHLPLLVPNEEGVVDKITVKEGKTQPPKRYTEGQLITLMKTAGKFLEDEQLEKILMKSEGLGTEATRAGIITLLQDRQYIKINKNQVFATDKGKILIDAIGETILASPEMTAKWEQRLKEIGEGKASPQQFMDQTKKLSYKILEDGQKATSDWDFEQYDLAALSKSRKKGGRGKGKVSSTPLGPCKRCEQGQVVDKGSFYGCNQYNTTKCSFTLSKRILGKTITQANIKLLLSTGKTDFIQGFKKGEKQFDAALKWDEQNKNTQFVFD